MQNCSGIHDIYELVPGEEFCTLFLFTLLLAFDARILLKFLKVQNKSPLLVTNSFVFTMLSLAEVTVVLLLLPYVVWKLFVLFVILLFEGFES